MPAPLGILNNGCCRGREGAHSSTGSRISYLTFGPGLDSIIWQRVRRDRAFYLVGPVVYGRSPYLNRLSPEPVGWCDYLMPESVYLLTSLLLDQDCPPFDPCPCCALRLVWFRLFWRSPPSPLFGTLESAGLGGSLLFGDLGRSTRSRPHYRTLS